MASITASVIMAALATVVLCHEVDNGKLPKGPMHEGRKPPKVITNLDSGRLPKDVEVWPLSFTSVLVLWRPPRGEILAYEVLYTDDESLPMYQWNMQRTGNNNITTIKGLTPRSVYAIKIQPITTHGRGQPSSAVLVKTQRGLPGAPSNIAITRTTTSTIELRWEKPTFAADDILGYELYWYDEFTEQENSTTLPLTHAHKLSDLYPETNYRIWVTAIVKDGEGAPTPSITAETKPPILCHPRKIKATVINRTAIRVRWKSPAKNSGKEFVAGYVIRVQEQDSQDIPNSQREYHVQDQETEEYNVTGLQPDTLYEIQVATISRIGSGPRSKALSVRTSGGVPTRPNMSVWWSLEEGSSVVELTWKPPIFPYGTLRNYRLIYGRKDVWKKHDMHEQKLDPRTERQTFYNLDYGAPYVFYLSGRNDLGWGPEAVAHFKTPEAAPTAAPENVTYYLRNPTTVVVSWTPPPLRHRNGEIWYLVKFHKTTERSAYEQKTPDTQMIFRGLEEDTDYVVIVRAYTTNGIGPESDRLIFSTPRYVPNAPTNLQAYATSRNAVEVRWEWDPSPYLYQVIGFQVMYATETERDADQWSEKTVPFTSSAELTGLKPNTMYFIIVTVETQDGLGHLSQPAKVKVDPTDVPLDLQATNITTNSIALSWKKPVNIDPITYQVSYTARKEYYNGAGDYEILHLPILSLFSNKEEHTLIDLVPFASYEINITVIAPDRQDRPPAKMIVTTPVAAPRPLEQPTVFNYGVEVTVILPPVTEENGPVTQYFVIVVPVKYVFKDPGEYSLKEFSSDGIGPFIAAKFLYPTVPSVFHLGDGKTYKRYLNRKLSHGKEYKLFVRACVKSSAKKSCTSSPFSETIGWSTEKVPPVRYSTYEVASGAHESRHPYITCIAAILMLLVL